MAYNIGPTLSVGGEREFARAMSTVREAMKYVKAEAAAVTSAYDKNDRSMEALTAQNKGLVNALELQKKAVDEAKNALKRMEDDGISPTSTAYKRMEANLNNAKAELNRTEREINQNENAMRDLSKETEKGADKQHKFADSLKKVGVAAGAATAALVAAAAAAAVKLGVEVVKQFGELEQNLGGSEAVFGQYAEAIQKSGEEAYKNLGLSQSEYLATANKMGALFQGSGMDQQKSLDLTTQAMQRAADMASVMGVDMSMAMESIAGAAKGNFTMMDNLGVAMNATSIEAYAAAKGFDFIYASATQAEKAEMAMRMFLENTEQYAGNFARESTQTITGSIGMLKAAVSSFVAGLGNANADMTNLTGNMVDSFKSVVANIVPVLKNIVKALPEAFNGIISALGELLPMLIETMTDIFVKVLETLVKLLPELIPVAVDAVLTIVEALIDNLPLIVDGAMQLIIALANGLIEALPRLIPAMVQAILTIVDTLLNNLNQLIPAALQIILALVQGLIQALPKLIEYLPTLIETIVDVLIENLPLLIDASLQIIVELAKGIIESLPELVKRLPEIITAIVEGLINLAVKLNEVGIAIVTEIWNGIKSAFDWIVQQIVGFFTGVSESVKAGGGSSWGGVGAGWAQDLIDGFNGGMNGFNPTTPTVPAYSYGSGSVSGQTSTNREENPYFIDLPHSELHRRSVGVSSPVGAQQINVTINSPTALSPSEIARETKNTMRQLAWGVS